MPFKKTRAASSNHPAPNVRETLADRITVRYAKSQFDNSVKPFLPAGHLNALVTRKSIVEELTDKPLTPDEVELALQNDEDHETVVDYVLLEAQKVFAITLISGLCGGELNETMWGFIQSDTNDTSLPLEEAVVTTDKTRFPDLI